MAFTVRFPDGFLWGTAISAHQTEGNNVHSDWWAWENSPRRLAQLKQNHKNPDDYRSGRACDFYNRFESDFDLIKSMNQNAFRLGVEWARIEPQEGKFSTDEVAHYRDVLIALKRRNIKTFVTLHHFTNPKWFSDRGGFARTDNIAFFVRFARTVTQALAPYVDFWITFNEPEIYTSHAYLLGKWPPQLKSWYIMYRVVRNIISAHIHVAAAIHTHLRQQVSMAFHLNDLQPASVFSHVATEVVRYLTNEYILRRVIKTCDYIGVNYYGHSHVGFFGRRFHSRSHHELSDLGWGIHPEGIERVLVSLKKFKKPVYITENGVADAADTKREAFIREHLRYTLKAIARGVDVRGYLHWSLMDNFEWDHGFGPKFGLVAVDYTTLTRQPRSSSKYYSSICKSNSI